MPNRRASPPPEPGRTPPDSTPSPPPGGHLRGASESLLQSLAHRLGRFRMALLDPDSARVEAIREEMLRAVEGVDAPGSARLRDRIAYAGDVDMLWQLRPDMHRLLDAALPPGEASKRLALVTARFVGVVSAAQRPNGRRR
jgi:hypothetical protein